MKFIGYSYANSQIMKSFLESNAWWFYFVLTYLISWSIWTAGNYLLSEDLRMIPLVLGAFGPFASAILIIRISQGKDELKRWLKLIFNLKINPGWYLLGAVLLPFGTACIHHLIFILLGGESRLEFSAEWLIYFAYLIPTALLSGGNEEPGWRGYITPVLIGKFNLILANLIVGIGWALWHMPLYVLGNWGGSDQSIFWLFMYCVPLSMIMTWLFYASGRSILPPMLFHAGSNVVFRYFPMNTNLSDTIEDEFTVVKTGIYWLLALIIIVMTKGTLGKDKSSR